MENEVLAITEKEMKEIKVERKSEKVKNWLKNSNNLALIVVLIFAFLIRLYYFWLTKNQPLWWDELCYGSLAKNLITHQWDGTSLIIGETHIRPLFFSLIWAFLMLLNLNEVGSRFLLNFVPSFVSVIFVYLISKEIYNKKTGIISAAIFSVFWLNLFYSSRFLVHMLELMFLSSSIYFFIIATKEKEGIGLKNYCLALFLLSIATLTRYQAGMVFFIYLVVLLVAKKLYLNRIKFWYSSVVGLLPLLIFFIINYISYGNIFPTLLSRDYIKPVESGTSLRMPFAFDLLNYIPTFLTKIFFVLFLIGLIYILFEIVLSYNIISKNQKIRNGVLIILLLTVFFSFFIFYMRAAEDRWLFETLISLAVIAGYGLSVCYEFISKYSKTISVILVVGVLIFGAYSQLSFADPLIKGKKESYLQMRQAFYWIKLNTPEKAVITGSGIEPYSIYYSERAYIQLSENESDIEKINNADYLILHAFTPQPKYLTDYVQNNNQTLEPVHVELLQNQPIAIIYKLKPAAVLQT